MMLTRDKRLGLLLLQAVVLLPLWLDFPVGVLLLCAAAMVDLALVSFGVKSPLSGLWKVAWVVASAALLVSEYRSLLLIEPWVALLMLMFASKALELKTARDAYQVLHLSYVIVMAQFLYDQSIFAASYALFCVALTLAVSVQLNSVSTPKATSLIKRVLSVIALTIPAFILLFLFLPRLPPLWAVPQVSSDARTGLSDRLAMGSIGRLIEDDSLALRLVFDEEIPTLAIRYLRAFTLTDFDGRVWSNERPTERQSRRMPKAESSVRAYELILEPSSSTVVPYLEYFDGTYPLGMTLGMDGQLRSSAEILQRTRVPLQYGVKGDVVGSLDASQYERAVALTKGGHGQLASWVREQALETKSVEERLTHIRRFFIDGGFRYSLTPPIAVGDPVDDFLFSSKVGFCEHFASAFAVMARMSGIPSRIVTGYQGGRFNPMGNYVEFRQYDAHAWAEVWIDREGWRRVDPTAWVSPERITSGAESLEDLPMFFDSVDWAWYRRFGSDLLWADLVLSLNALQHYWDQRVLNFSQKDQTQILQWFWPDLDASDSVHVALAGVIVLFVSIALLESIRGRMNLTRTNALRDREHLLRGLNWISPIHGFTHASPLKSMSFPNDGLKNSWILTWNDLVHAYDRVHYAGQQDEQRYLRQALWRWQIRAGLEAVKRILGTKARSGKHG
ncbi:MAG: DUF3488 and transglutaminase-like domain-containing protein [Gammaproteobacteria bacterium]